MFGKKFQLTEQTISVVEEIGKHMPGGFFIYRSGGSEELMYANRIVFDIFGCKDKEEFSELTDFTFKGMVHPEDYEKVSGLIAEQTSCETENLAPVEHRIIRKDGTVRWVESHVHFTETDAYGRIYYVFVADVTEKRARLNSDLELRQAVINALSESYRTVWLITDIETGEFSYFSADSEGYSFPDAVIKDEHGIMRYSPAKDYYISRTVTASDRERLSHELSIDTIAKNLAKRNQWSIVYLRLMNDGSERYFRIEFAKVDMPSGKIGVVCCFRDIDEDERRRSEIRRELIDAEQTKENNKKLMEEIQSAAKLAELMGSVASLLSNMPAMSFSKDAETGRYLACNQSFADYANRSSPEDIVGLTDYDLFDAENASRFLADDKKALAMDTPYIYFEEVPGVDGKPRHLQTTKLKFIDDNGRVCTLGMCVDVTEMTRMKAAEAREQELEARLALQEKLMEEEQQRAQQKKMITALASDYKSVYYVELDKDEGICYQEYHDVENYIRLGEHFPYMKTFSEYAEKYITDQYRDEFMRFVQPAAIREGLKQQRVISYRYMVVRNGVESYEMLRFAGVRHPEDRDDHYVHAVSVCVTDVDIETRKSLDQSRVLSQALSAAEAASRAKTVFLSNMSHEIRTPMNAIIGLDNIALNDPDISPRTREHLEKINSSAEHLLNIINDILDMSRIESGRMTIKNEEFAFSKVLEQINNIISNQCRDKGIEYKCLVKGILSDYYVGDCVKLQQVMINILGNAVKFTPQGGSVGFEIEETASFDGHSTLRFIISDTGIGMSCEYLPQLFEPFSQEDASAPNKYGSTGLGMPITKSLVKLMNGNIEVESEKGKGTTFTVTVTFDDAKDREHQENESNMPQPRDMTVLIIDDDPVACEHAQIVLSQVGISCDIACSGAEGLKMAETRHTRRQPYNLIIIDWQMPIMDGIETTRRIRAAVGNESAIIILTSYNWDDVIDEAREAGVDTFVPKPLFATTVIDEFRTAFRKKRDSAQNRKADLRGKRVLIAEDVAINAEIIQMMLSMREMLSDTAENGKLAVEMFEAHEPGYYSAVLMDMRMPVMNGLEAAKAIRAMSRPDSSDIPIIALTANAFDEDVQRSMQAGLNAHLSKPVRPEILFATLEELIV